MSSVLLHLFALWSSANKLCSLPTVLNTSRSLHRAQEVPSTQMLSCFGTTKWDQAWSTLLHELRFRLELAAQPLSLCLSLLPKRFNGEKKHTHKKNTSTTERTAFSHDQLHQHNRERQTNSQWPSSSAKSHFSSTSMLAITVLCSDNRTIHPVISSALLPAFMASLHLHDAFTSEDVLKLS